jgi:hypothetical protein
MAQQTQQAPSKLLKVNQWVKRKYGHDGWWTCIQVDHAVMMFGSKVESLLNEFHPKTGKPVHKLDALLHKSTEPVISQQVTRLSRNNSMVSQKPARKQRKQPTTQETA